MKKLFSFLSASILMLAIFTGCDNLNNTVPDEASGLIKGKVLYQDGITDSSGIPVFLDKLDDSGRALSFMNYSQNSRAADASYYKSTVTNNDGSYEFADLPQGLYTVIAGSEKDEYRSVARGIEISENNAEIELADMHLVAVGSLSGTLEIEGGEVSGSLVGAMDKDGYIVSETIVSSKGLFKISGLPVGEYNLVVKNGDKYEELGTTYTVKTNEETKISENVKLYYDSTYVFDLYDVAETVIPDWAYEYDGNKMWSAGINFTLYTAGRKVEKNDLVRVKGIVIPKEDYAGNIGIEIVDSSLKTDWYKSLSGGEMQLKGPLEKGKEYEFDFTFKILYNQESNLNVSFYCNRDSEKAPEFTIKRTSGSTKTYYSDIINSSYTNYVSAYTTDTGVVFSGPILSNVKTDGDSTDASATIEIQCQTGNWITMQQSYTKPSSGEWNNWSLEYPLVEKDKVYTFGVKVYNGSWTMYEEEIYVKTSGGLGEFAVENADTFKNVLTTDKVMKREGTPAFTDNSNIQILRQGVDLTLNQDETGWVIENTFWADNSDLSYPLKQAININNWRPYEFIDAMMSGHDYRITSTTVLKIAGYTYGDTVTFRMNDWLETTDSWGGERYKQLVVIGAFIDNYDSNNYNFCDSDYFESLKEQGITVSGLPGTKITVPEDNSYNWVSGNGVYPYAFYVDFGSTINEPADIPVITVTKDSKKDTGVYRFKGWSESFPVSLANIWYDWGTNKASYGIYYINAEFETVQPKYTVTYYRNRTSTDKTVLATQTMASGIYGYNLVFPDNPELNGMKFAGWFKDALCKEKVSEGTLIEKNTSIYAGWINLTDKTSYILDDYTVNLYNLNYYQFLDKDKNVVREGNYTLDGTSLSFEYNGYTYNCTVDETTYTLSLDTCEVYVSPYEEGTYFWTNGFNTGLGFENNPVDLTGFKYLNIEAYSPDCGANIICMDAWTASNPTERGGRYEISYMSDSSRVYQSVWGTNNDIWYDWDSTLKQNVEKKSTSNILNYICIFTNNTDQDDREATVYVKRVWATNEE